MNEQMVCSGFPVTVPQTLPKARRKGRRALQVSVALFVLCGVTAIALLMASFPQMSLQQGRRMYASVLRGAQVGEIVSFGAYEQDGDAADGAESIEWIVLSRQDNQVLLLSRYALDCQPFEHMMTMATWKNSTLQAWLNDTFYQKAFGAPEQAMITECVLTAGDNPMFAGDPGEKTKGKVFLLSFTEAETYLGTDMARKCRPTAFAEQRGVQTEGGFCRWWLRTAGFDMTTASHIRMNGSISDCGHFVGNALAVRPAIWVSFDAVHETDG